MKAKEWREYMSEEGDSWTILTDSETTETTTDMISVDGNEAVQCLTYQTADYVVVSILPKARVQRFKRHNPPYYEPYDKTLFYLKLELMNGDDWFCLTAKHYGKDEVMKLASLFVGLNKQQAERVWTSKKLGKINTSRIDKE